jgi:hypothetical protein
LENPKKIEIEDFSGITISYIKNISIECPDLRREVTIETIFFKRIEFLINFNKLINAVSDLKNLDLLILSYLDIIKIFL